MQRFLLFILVVVFTCIVLVRIFMIGYEPVELMASTDPAAFGTRNPVFNGGQMLLDVSWSEARFLYLCKLIILMIIVLVAVLNYRSFMAEQEETEA